MCIICKDKVENSIEHMELAIKKLSETERKAWAIELKARIQGAEDLKKFMGINVVPKDLKQALYLLSRYM